MEFDKATFINLYERLTGGRLAGCIPGKASRLSRTHAGEESIAILVRILLRYPDMRKQDRKATKDGSHIRHR